MKKVFDHSASLSIVDRNQVRSSRINDSDTKMEIISDTNLELSVSIVSSTKFNNKLVTRTTLRLDIVDTEITHRFFRILTNDHISKPAYSINVCE
ncbi:hypothetical protein VNVC001_29740 [Vibrio cholerae]|nr:hypothetical protein VNVC001_29740 [Vibrio cholerae]